MQTLRTPEEGLRLTCSVAAQYLQPELVAPVFQSAGISIPDAYLAFLRWGLTPGSYTRPDAPTWERICAGLAHFAAAAEQLESAEPPSRLWSFRTIR